MADPVSTLVAVLRDLPPWPAAPDPDLGPADWERYVSAAQLVRGAEPFDVERALTAFLAEGEGFTAVENETRAFLLLRLLFELPRRVPVAERRPFKGWLNWPEPNAEGYVDLSWPIEVHDGRPRLVARYAGAEGPRYAAAAEYQQLRTHYRYRELA